MIMILKSGALNVTHHDPTNVVALQDLQNKKTWSYERSAASHSSERVIKQGFDPLNLLL